MNKHAGPHEWYHRPLPDNIQVEEGCFIVSSYAFNRFASRVHNAFEFGRGSGLYHFNANIVTGEAARIAVGRFTCLNGCAIIAHDQVSIGSYCLVAWGAVITDEVPPSLADAERRRDQMLMLGRDPERRPRAMGRCAPVTIGDNVWIGFKSVVSGGVTIGRGAVIGCQTYIDHDVPPYAVVFGSPARILYYLDPSDSPEAERAALEIVTREQQLPR